MQQILLEEVYISDSEWPLLNNSISINSSIFYNNQPEEIVDTAWLYQHYLFQHKR